MKIRPFSYCLFFLVMQAFIFTGVTNLDFTPLMYTINEPMPIQANTETTAWLQPLTSVGEAVIYIGQVLGWALAKIWAYMSIINMVIFPSWEGMLAVVSIINSCLVIIMVLSAVSLG